LDLENWGNGEMGKWENGEIERWVAGLCARPFKISQP
jgi:hypothetical protein